MDNSKSRENSAGDRSQLLREKKSELYRIKVAGVVHPDWSPRLGGLRIESRTGDALKEQVTVLEGTICDQAQLSGILNTLYDLRYELLSVKKLTKRN